MVLIYVKAIRLKASFIYFLQILDVSYEFFRMSVYYVNHQRKESYFYCGREKYFMVTKILKAAQEGTTKK
jgi:hypothetical protein